MQQERGKVMPREGMEPPPPPPAQHPPPFCPHQLAAVLLGPLRRVIAPGPGQRHSRRNEEPGRTHRMKMGIAGAVASAQVVVVQWRIGRADLPADGTCGRPETRKTLSFLA